MATAKKRSTKKRKPAKKTSPAGKAPPDDTPLSQLSISDLQAMYVLNTDPDVIRMAETN